MVSLAFRTMGCAAHAVLDDEIAALGALAWVPGWFAARERRLSRFDRESDLSRLNAAGSAPVHEELWRAILVALEAARSSDGLVTPTVLPALEACGYDRSFEHIAEHVDARPTGSPPVHDGRAIVTDPTSREVRLSPGVRLDLGGTAKGWCADRAARRLGANAPALVDVGGDIAVSGSTRDGEGWPVAIADPTDPGRVLALLRIRGGGVATSGRDYRRWRQGGIERHHVIDPRTSAPARTNVVAATVVGPSCLDAEVAAKVVLVLGAREGLAWVDARPELASLVVLDDGTTRTSRDFARHLWE